MFNTIKSKIIALTGTVLFLLLLLMFSLSFFNFKGNKELIIKGNKFNIEHFISEINNEILKFEDNVSSLALLGEFYAQSNKDDSLLDKLVIRDFQNYPHSLGGGIWFKPYMINPKKRLLSTYAYYNTRGEVVLDNISENSNYDYPMQRWYLEILPNLTPKHNIFWSTPYYETHESDIFMTTVGAGIYRGNELIGLATVDWKMSSVLRAISQMRPTPNSFVLFADKQSDFVISTTDPWMKDKKIWGLSLKLIPWYQQVSTSQNEFKYHGRTYIPYIKTLDNGMLFIINIPKDELFSSTIRYFIMTFSILLLACLLITAGIFIILQRNINKPIDKLTKLTNQIGQGNLDARLDLDKPLELSNLAHTLNKMASDLKENLISIANISKAKEKIEAELSVARNIQRDALPHQFPVKSSFELIASMTPARDVGGDFYDFFSIDSEHFAFVMADVSGKGITAALFMMSAKTMIKNILQTGHSLEKVAEKVNRGLYDNNSRGMFVTAFISVLNLKTGEVRYINAGHCPPLIKSKSGYRYLEPVRNLMLGIMPSYQYQIGTFTLKPGERIFLYTDGVTEAQNREEKLFGPTRLEKSLNQETTSLPDTLNRIKKDIDQYVNGAEQSDDITMMELLYYGLNDKAQVFPAELSAWTQVKSFIKEQIKCSDKKYNSIELATEEIFTNIAKYAYTDKGTVRLQIKDTPKAIELTFADWGKPYNPLPIKKPNLSTSVAERKIGGLGLYMTGKIADKINYSRQDGQNILTLHIKR